MDFESFSAGTSIMHAADVRLKLIGAFSFSVVVALCHSLPGAALALLVGLLLLAAARLAPLQVARRLLLVNLFLLFFWGTLPFSAAGPAFDFGLLHISQAGLRLATLVTLKTNAIIMVFLALVTTSSMVVIGHGLAALRLPNRLCVLLLFTYRYIFVLQQEYQRLRRAALLRGFVPATSLHTYRTYGNLLGMTLVKSWQRGIRVQQAMQLRGFQGRFYLLTPPAVRGRDWLLFILLFMAVSAVAVTELTCRAGGC